jgi:hypothetical protein
MVSSVAPPVRGGNFALGTPMKARQIVESGSFGPETLKVARQAFDEAWASVAAHFGNDPLLIEAARLKLANAVLAKCHDEMGDLVALKQAALGMLARQYRLNLNAK